MPPTRNQDDSVVERQNRLETRMDNMQDRVSKLEAKIVGAIVLQSVNLGALVFVIGKLFELSARLPYK